MQVQNVSRIPLKPIMYMYFTLHKFNGHLYDLPMPYITGKLVDPFFVLLMSANITDLHEIIDTVCIQGNFRPV